MHAYQSIGNSFVQSASVGYECGALVSVCLVRAYINDNRSTDTLLPITGIYCNIVWRTLKCEGSRRHLLWKMGGKSDEQQKGAMSSYSQESLNLLN